MIVAEYVPFPDRGRIHGVTFDGKLVWFARDNELVAFDPETEKVVRRHAIPEAQAGTAFDGKHLYQIAENRIQKVDPKTGRVIGSIPAPGTSSSGLAWSEGTLWVGDYNGRRIHQVDPETGALLRTIASDRFVTGVTWVDGELWHATWEGQESELRHVDPENGAVLEQVDLPRGVKVSGLESDGGATFYCGGENGKLRAIRRPRGA